MNWRWVWINSQHQSIKTVKFLNARTLVKRFEIIIIVFYGCIRDFFFVLPLWAGKKLSRLNIAPTNQPTEQRCIEWYIRSLSIYWWAQQQQQNSQCVWNQSVYYFSHSVSVFPILISIFDCAYVLFVLCSRLPSEEITHWCCNGKEMHNKDDRTQLLKLCTINSKLIKEKKMEKMGFSQEREREREKNLQKHTHSPAILSGWQKIVYTVTFCFSLHHHLTEVSNTKQPNRNDRSTGDGDAEWAVYAIEWIVYILSSSNEANEAEMKA